MQLATTYVSVAQFKAMANDNAAILSAYSDPQLLDLLTRASGTANGIMKRSLLAQQGTEIVEGTGSDVMLLPTNPVIYVRQIQFVMPGLTGFVLPTSRLLVDGRRGAIVTYAPLELQGIGEFSIFPRGTPFAVTYGSGYGYNPTTPPAWTAQDAPGGVRGGLAPGQYLIGITTCTEWGETLPAYQLVTTASGAVQATLSPVLGAFKFRYFVAEATTLTGPTIATDTALPVASTAPFAVNQQIIVDAGTARSEIVTIQAIVPGSLTVSPMTNPHAANASVAPVPTLVGEIPATTFSTQAAVGTIAALAPPSGYYPESVPTTDTSAIPTPGNIMEAVRLLVLSSIYEQNNLANRGVAGTTSKDKRTQWRSTEGSSGRGVPTLWSQAAELLAGKRLSAIF